MEVINIFLFLISIFLLFYLPGRFLTYKLKLEINLLEDVFLSTVLGLVFSTLIFMIFSFLKVEFIGILIILFLDLFIIKDKFWANFALNRKDIKPVIIIFLVSLIFSLPMISNGYLGRSLKLTGDSLWYLALINELKVNFPPFHPGFAGTPLTGYHFLFFFILAKISNIFHLSPIELLFRYSPTLVSVLWAIGTYVLMFKWSKSRTTALWSVFLSMLGGSFVFFSWFEGHKSLSLDSGYGMLQPAASLLNPPFAISVVIMIAFIFSIYQYLNQNKKQWLVPIVLFAGMVSLFKVYAGMIMLGGFLLFFLFNLYKKKFIVIIAAMGILVLFMSTYWPFTDKSAHLIFFPWWAPHDVLLLNMPWYRYDERIYTYTKLGVIKGWIETELYAVYIYFIGNLGTRFIGFLAAPIYFIWNKKWPSVFSIVLFFMLTISILIPLFFIQTGKVFEITQMTWYFLYLSSLFASFGLTAIFRLKYSRIIKIILFVFLIIITLPSALSVIYFYVFNNPGFVSDRYYKAMQFLQKDGSYNQTILQVPDQKIRPNDKDLLSWYRNGSTKIVALSNKRAFLNYEFFDFKETDPRIRIAIIKRLISAEKESVEGTLPRSLYKQINNDIKNNKIVYVYSSYPLTIFERADFIKKIYDDKNGNIIYKTN